MIEECIKEAKKAKMKGVAVVTRKGPFMAHNDIFLKKGFQMVDNAEPDFELLVKKFDAKSKNPKFKSSMTNSLKKYGKGLTIIRSAQCPYSEKNVNAIMETAKNKLSLKANIVDLKDSNAVQNTPCAFGTFCIIYNGEIISHHPISNTRFENIMKKKIKMICEDGVRLPPGFDIDITRLPGLHLVKILTEDQLEGNLQVISNEETTFIVEYI